MASLLGRNVTNNASGIYTPDWGPQGTGNGFFVANMIGDISIRPPVNSRDGGAWYLMLNNPDGHWFTWDSSYHGFETQGGSAGTYAMQIVTDSALHFILSTSIFYPQQQAAFMAKAATDLKKLQAKQKA